MYVCRYALVVYYEINFTRQTILLEFDKKLNSLSNQTINIDLDDGVKVNYEKLAEILYKVKM